MPSRVSQRLPWQRVLATPAPRRRPDIRRDIEIIDASEVDVGDVTARIRTWNILYVARSFEVIPELDPARRIAIEDLWH